MGSLPMVRFCCAVSASGVRRANIATASVYDSDQRRRMMLVSKVIQNMSNHLCFGAKEPFMLPMNDQFMERMIPKMKELQGSLAVRRNVMMSGRLRRILIAL